MNSEESRQKNNLSLLILLGVMSGVLSSPWFGSIFIPILGETMAFDIYPSPGIIFGIFLVGLLLRFRKEKYFFLKCILLVITSIIGWLITNFAMLLILILPLWYFGAFFGVAISTFLFLQVIHWAFIKIPRHSHILLILFSYIMSMLAYYIGFYIDFNLFGIIEPITGERVFVPPQHSAFGGLSMYIIWQTSVILVLGQIINTVVPGRPK